jgi:hypothetical protein
MNGPFRRRRGEVTPARIFRDERNANRMSRSRVRVCLQDGLRLDLNRLARKGFIKFGTNIGARGIVWTNSYWGVVHGIISADMSNQNDAWLRIQIGDPIQPIAPLQGATMVVHLEAALL